MHVQALPGPILSHPSWVGVISFTFMFFSHIQIPSRSILDLISFQGFREVFTGLRWPFPHGCPPQATQKHLSKTKFMILPLPDFPEQRVSQPNKKNHQLYILRSFPSLLKASLSSKIPLVLLLKYFLGWLFPLYSHSHGLNWKPNYLSLWKVCAMFKSWKLSSDPMAPFTSWSSLWKVACGQK